MRRFFHGWGRGGVGRRHRTMQNGHLTLSDADEGRFYTMIGLTGGERFRERIYSMGLNPGVKFKTLMNSGHGPIELEVRQTKLAIGRGMAERIKISEDGQSG